MFVRASSSPNTNSKACRYGWRSARAIWKTALMRRDTLEKEVVPQEGLIDRVAALMDEIQQGIFDKARSFRDSMITPVDTWEDFVRTLDTKGGFVAAHWDGTVETEVAIKEATKATIRCIPLDAVDEEGACIYSGKPSHRRVLFARSY